MSERKQLTRKELYELVWEKPITHLAKELDTQPYQLHKLLKEFKIPKPLPGYWSKLKHGKDVDKRPLPANEDLDYKPIIITSYGYVKPQPTKRKKRTVYVKSPIPITKTLHADRLHPLVRKTMKTGFELDNFPEIYGLHVPKETCLEIKVYPETIRRSLLLTDTIIKAIEARGHKLRIGTGEKRFWPSSGAHEVEECYFDIKGEKVRFAISEKMNRIDRPIGEKEKRQLEMYGSLLYKYKYISSGILKVKILEAYYREDTWMDNERMTVEQQIPLIVRCILTSADRQKKTRIQGKIAERRRIEEKKVAKLRKLKNEQEKQRIDDLNAQVKKWKKAVSIRAYLKAFEEAVRIDEEYEDHGMKYWLNWAHGYADQIDPLTMFG